jgi:hypothetical protein
MGLLFSTTRQVLIFSFFILWCCIDVALLGLISEQITKFGNNAENYPSGMYYHALGLGLFATIFYLIVGLTNWALGHLPLTFLMFTAGVFFGTVAGILEATPFGHGLQCGNPVDKFPANYQPFVDQCSRITAISGLAWAMFGLAVIGFFFLLQDKFSCTSKRAHLYEPYVGDEEKAVQSPIKH